MLAAGFLSMLSRCDRYFWLPARGEHRGTGGVFFDDLEATDTRFDAEQVSVSTSYVPVVLAKVMPCSMYGQPFAIHCGI